MTALAVAVLAAATAAGAGEGAPRDCEHPVGFRRGVCDAVELARGVALRDRGDRNRAIAVVGVAAALYAARDDVREAIRDDRSAGRTRLFERGRVLGKGAAAPLAAAGLLVAYAARRESRDAETAQLLLESMAASAAVAAVGSVVLAAERPEDGDRVRAFRTRGHGVSLDVALAASTAGMLAGRPLKARPGEGRSRRFWKGAGRASLHAAVVLTALQRIDADKHWAPDVWLGAAGGYGVAGILVRAHEPREGSVSSLPSVVPAPGGAALVWDLSRPRGR